MQFDGEKPDKITRGACACNDDKVIFENPLNWTTRSFIFAKQREHENGPARSEEHTSELQSQSNLVCRLLLEKKKNMLNLHTHLRRLMSSRLLSSPDAA